MNEQELPSTDRRGFLQASTLAAVSGGIVAGSARAQDAAAKIQDAPADQTVLPRRKLGKTGVEITMLNQGVVRGATIDRALRQAFAAGVRTFDTAKVYGTEPNFKKWFEQDPTIRKQIFLVTKDMPKQPNDLLAMLDQRLEALGTDYIDLFFIHGLGDEHSLDAAVNFVKGDEFKQVADKIRKSGKAKFVGFSTHHKDRAAMIQAAAEAGIVDAIMLQYTPWLEKDSPLNKALDVAHAKNVGLITMKHIAGQFFGDKPKGNILEDVAKRVPDLKERNFSPFQGLLQAIWTDERVSSSCVSMRNTDQLRENCDAARRFQPLKEAALQQLKDAVLAHRRLMCADCDGRCSEAAGTKAELGNLARYLTYHQHHGNRAEARKLYAQMPPEARDWSNADLAAAQQACPNRLDFAQLMPEAKQRLS